MKTSVVVVLSALAVAAAAAGGYWLGAKREPATVAATGAPAAAGKGAASAGPAVTVEVDKVAFMAMPQTITTVGSLRSDESVTLRPEVAGRIAAIQFQEGQRVAKGTTLVRLDPAVNQAEV